MKKCVASLFLLLSMGMVNAAPIVQEATITPSKTNFLENIEFSKFDDQNGSLTLLSVFISFEGLLDGSIGVESSDASATAIETTVSTSLTLNSVDLGTLLDLSPPDIQESFDADPFDGNIDFSGSSGTFYDDIGGAIAGSASFTDASVLDFFTGDDMFTLAFEAIAASFASGSGNLTTEFTMTAGGIVRLEYEAIENVVVSSPHAFAIFSLAAFALFGYRRLAK